MNKKIAIVLGGTAPHIEVIRQLKERGFYTILIDYFDNPPARAAADEHIKESTMDQEKVLEIARERNASLVISACVDQANITACYALEKMGLYAPYSYETAKKITNKGDMKKAMLDNDIPTSKYIYIDDASNIPEIDLQFPLMVKPADSNSANGVKKAENPEELKEYLDNAIKISRSNRAIVEEFVEGPEISMYCFVQDKKAHLIMTAERISIIEGEKNVLKCYSTIAPARPAKGLENRIEEVATKIASVFELDNTPLFIQAIVKDGDVSIIEFMPRVGGSTCFSTIHDNTGFDIISATIDSYLGIRPELNYHKCEHLLITNEVYGKNCVFDHFEGEDELLKNNVIKHMIYHKAKGAVIENSRAATSRLGACIIEADSEDEMYDKVKTAFEKLDAFDDKGENIIRREINIYNLLKCNNN